MVFRVLALVSLALLSFSTGCDSASVSRPADPTATATLTRTPTSTRTATRTLPVDPTSTPAPTNTVPTLFTPSPTPTSTTGVPTASHTPTRVVTPTATPTGAAVSVSRAIVDASDTAFVDIVLVTGGNDVGGMQNDLLFDNTIVRLSAASRCRINPEIGDRLPNCELDPQEITAPCKTLARNLVQCGSLPQPDGCPDGVRASTSRFRAIIAATAVPNTNPIPDGVLYTCEFEVVDRSRLPQAILNRNLIVADPSGGRFGQFSAGDGLITAAARTSATALQGANELLIHPEDASRFPATGTIQVLDQLVGFNRTGPRLSLFAPLAQIVPADSLVYLAPAPATPTRTATSTQTPGSPTSTPSPTPSEVPTAVSTATPVPTAITPVVPTSTATVVPTDTPVPTATVQGTDTPEPTSTVTVVPTPSATVTTTVATPTATMGTPTVQATPTATATATPVDTPTPAAIVAIVSADAAAGQVVIDVRLDAPGGNVGGVQNDILFDNTILALPGVTRCRINPAIGTALPNCEEDTPQITEPCKTLSRLIVTCGGDPQPNGCPDDADATVSRFRAVIGATAVPNQNPIPDGVIYTCTFDVLDAGSLPTILQATKVVAADAVGERVEPAVGVDGEARP